MHTGWSNYFNMLDFQLKVQSCKSYNNKYMIASIQTTNTEVFPFISVLVLKLLSQKSFVYKQKKTIETLK